MRALTVWILALLVPFAVAQCPSSRDSATDTRAAASTNDDDAYDGDDYGNYDYDDSGEDGEGELLEDPMGHAFEVYFDSKV